MEVSYDSGPRVTVLSPTDKRLEALARRWFDTVEAGKWGCGADGTLHDVSPPLDDLESVAAECAPKDDTIPNGSSIALLVEHRGASIVLGADAFGTVLGAALAGVAHSRGLEVLPVDAFKLPHHCSKRNVLEAMLRLAPAQHYLVSTNGDFSIIPTTPHWQGSC